MPQPIDMQTELGRASMAERIQELSGRASLAARQQSGLDAEQTSVDAETVVNETQDTENPEVDAEGRRRNPFVKQRRKTKADEAKGKTRRPRSAPDSEDHQLDVTV